MAVRPFKPAPGTAPAGGVVLIADTANLVSKVDPAKISSSDGIWVSQALGRADPQAEYTLKRVVFRYTSTGTSTVLVAASGNGGATWNEEISVPVTLTADEMKRALAAPFNTTGYDLRIRFRLVPADVAVNIYGFRVTLVQRSSRGRIWE